MSDFQLEIWWVAKCKSPGCLGALLLDRLEDDKPREHRMRFLPQDDLIVDWTDTCRACGLAYLYSKRDVFSVRTGQSDPGTGSAAFRRARRITQRMRTPHVGARVSIQGRSGAFIVAAVRTNPSVVDLKLIAPNHHVQNDVPWGVLVYLDEQRADSC